MTPLSLLELMVALFLVKCASDTGRSLWTVGFVVAALVRFVGSIRHDSPSTLKWLHALTKQASNIFIPLCFLLETAKLGGWDFGPDKQSKSVADVMFTLALLVWISSCVGKSLVGGVFWLCCMSLLCAMSAEAFYFEKYPESPFLLAGAVAVVSSGPLLRALFPRVVATGLSRVAAGLAMECFRRAAVSSMARLDTAAAAA